jgi:hypothetical protein
VIKAGVLAGLTLRLVEAQKHPENTMDKMEWAQWGLEYLRKARAEIHGDFNEVMNEFRGSHAVHRESWFSASKNIVSTLYHYSMEFVEDRTIPGSRYASPQAFQDKLDEYHAFVDGMKAQLIEEDKKYKEISKTDDMQWLVSEAFRPVIYLLDAVEYVQSKVPNFAQVAPEMNDIQVVEKMARRFHESVLSLARHPRSKPTLAVEDEWDCQYLFRSILASYFPDIRDEEWGPSVAGSAARCEFFLKTLRTMIELKYVRSRADQKKIKAELATDFVDYGNNPLVEHLVCLVYDPTHAIQNPAGFQSDLSGTKAGLTNVSIIISPPREA